MKKMSFVALIICIFFILPTDARASSVPVSLPDFKVTLNDIEIDSKNREYPLLVYNNITYFPMTYFDCRFAGLETTWNNEAGLQIIKTDVSGAYRDYGGAANTHRVYQAEKTSFPIVVNNKTIDNNSEQYPLLIFRNVTYFPLTWRFAVDEFGWKYSYDDKSGLIISSTNPRVKNLELPNFRKLSDYEDGLEYEYAGVFTLIGDTVYYLAEDEKIYRAPLNNPAQRTLVYTFSPSLKNESDLKENVSLDELNGDLLIIIQGGQVTSSGFVTIAPRFYSIKPDGTVYQLDKDPVGPYFKGELGGPSDFGFFEIYGREAIEARELEINNLVARVNSYSQQPDAPLSYVKMKGDYIVAGFEHSPATKYYFMIFDKTGKVVYRGVDAASQWSISGKNLIYALKETGDLFQVLI